ncbi:MAG: hypothetical protein AAF500_06230 [Myxococcota bacterium]
METPPRVMDLAIACVTSVKNATGLELDMTQDTLPVLDHYARMVESSQDEIVSLLGPMCGAYFGEVLRRHLDDGDWENTEEDYDQWRLGFEPGSLSFNPVGLALEVLLKTEVAAWGAHLEVAPSARKAADEALAVYRNVRQDDFFRFAVRFEGIEQAYRALLNDPKGMAPRP